MDSVWQVCSMVSRVLEVLIWEFKFCYQSWDTKKSATQQLGSGFLKSVESPFAPEARRGGLAW